MRVLRVVTISLSFALLVACSSGDQSDVMNVDENLTTVDDNEPLTADSTPVAAPLPTHLYAIHEGDRYGYVAAVSEEDQKRGKAAGDVVFFVYRGRQGDTYKLDVVTPTGEVVEDDECERPCNAIKRYQWGGVSYIGFEPNSLIGEAYTDAFNGFLKASPVPTVRATETNLPSLVGPSSSVADSRDGNGTEPVNQTSSDVGNSEER